MNNYVRKETKMPELKGFEEKDGKVYAIIHFPDAKKYTLKPEAAARMRQEHQMLEKNGGHHESR